MRGIMQLRHAAAPTFMMGLLVVSAAAVKAMPANRYYNGTLYLASLHFKM